MTMRIPEAYRLSATGFLASAPRRAIGILLFLLMLGSCGLSACGTPTSSFGSSTSVASAKTTLVVFEAGSLMVPMAEVEKAFEKAHPNIDVQIEAHGSIQVIRHVTELGEDVDVVAVADYSLVPLLMYASFMPDGRPFAEWYIKPATNELVLARSAASKHADEINAGNWYEIIARSDVRLGLSDPRMDAVGYRTLMACKLAEAHYGVQNILRDAIGSSMGNGIVSRDEEGKSYITVSELLEPSDRHISLRGSSMQLISLLESGGIDYTFEYKSVVEQHNLDYVQLPPQVNLGDASMADTYGRVTVKIDFRRFKTVTPVFDGAPIGYGLTIPQNSSHKSEAAEFIRFILGADGGRIFLQCHHPLLVPPECDNVKALPDALKSFFQ